MNRLAKELSWSWVLSPASSQVLGRVVYPVLHQLGSTYGSWDFCNSFHSISIVSDLIHALGLQGKNTDIIWGLYQLGELQKNIRSFCSWESRGKRAEKVWLTVPEYTGDMNQKRSCVIVAGEFIDLWFTALQGPFGMQKERMMKGIVSHGDKARQNTQRCYPWEREYIQVWPTAWERGWGRLFFIILKFLLTLVGRVLEGVPSIPIF